MSEQKRKNVTLPTCAVLLTGAVHLVDIFLAWLKNISQGLASLPYSRDSPIRQVLRRLHEAQGMSVNNLKDSILRPWYGNGVFGLKLEVTAKIRINADRIGHDEAKMRV